MTAPKPATRAIAIHLYGDEEDIYRQAKTKRVPQKHLEENCLCHFFHDVEFAVAVDADGNARILSVVNHGTGQTFVPARRPRTRPRSR